MTTGEATIQTIKGPFEAIPAGAADFTFAAGTITDGDQFVCTGKEILILFNNDAGACTVTITSADDEKGRSEDVSAYSLAAGDYAAFGMGLTNSPGWKNSSGKIKFTVSDADVKYAVLRLPAGFPK